MRRHLAREKRSRPSDRHCHGLCSARSTGNMVAAGAAPVCWSALTMCGGRSQPMLSTPAKWNVNWGPPGGYWARGAPAVFARRDRWVTDWDDGPGELQTVMAIFPCARPPPGSRRSPGTVPGKPARRARRPTLDRAVALCKDSVNRAASVLMADTAERAGAQVRADLLHGSRLAAAGGQP